jgi:hypothetical protein
MSLLRDTKRDVMLFFFFFFFFFFFSFSSSRSAPRSWSVGTFSHGDNQRCRAGSPQFGYPGVLAVA